MVECVRPEPPKTIADPACGTGGFFLGAYQWLTRPGNSLDRRQKEFLLYKTFHGNEIVPSTRRLCLMNLFLHNIGDLDGEPIMERADALIADPSRRFDYVLANPPFRKKSSHPENRHEHRETERFRYFAYDDLIARDKASLEIFCLKDDSLDNLDELPPPDVLAQEIIDHLEAVLAAFRDVAAGLRR